MTNGSFQASCSVQLSGTFPPQGVLSLVSPLRNTVIGQAASAQPDLTYGAGTGKVNLIVCSDHDLAASGGADDATYDLYTGTDLRDLDGGAAPFRVVRYAAVFIITGGDSAGVRVGGAASDCWPAFFADATDKWLIKPGGLPFQGCTREGVAVGTTTKNLYVENLGAVPVTIRTIVAGSSTT